MINIMKNLLFLLLVFVIVSCSESPKFQLLSSDITGVKFNNTITESDSFNLMQYEYIYNGAGVGVADFNNDGLEDLFFAGNQVSPRAYLNTGNFKFKDITANFEGLTNNQWYSGVTIVDINNDGRPDVYLTSTQNKDPEKRKNRLWINNGSKDGGDPTFTEMAEKYGIADTSQSVHATFFDYDLDGNLDLYVLNNTVNSRMNTNYRQKMIDGSAQNNDHLYHNNGDGTFTNVTKKAGIVYEGFGLGLAVGDVNKDGYPDIYISNDFISNDLLYINQKDGTFKNEITKYLSYQSRSSMGDDMADVNNDGNPDIYTLDMFPENYWKKKQTINGFSYMYYKLDREFNFEHQYVRNMFHLHNGFLNGKMLPYSEIGQMLGIQQTEWSWSPLFADYNNDGFKDLIISNGFPKDETDKDWTRFKVTAAGFYASDQLLIDMAPAIKIPNIAFENTDGLNFVKKNDWLPQVPSYSYGAAFVDLDNDGDLDYVTNNLNDEAFIMRNTTVEKSKKQSNFLRIKLTGSDKNTMAIGAKVELWNNGKYQFIENFLNRGYASSVDPIIHFGLGTDKQADSIKITWPENDRISILKNVKADQLVEIKEESSVPKPLVKIAHPELLFTKIDSTLKYVHNQNDFVDFELNQTIIPHKFSQIGPRMCKGDLNNDGIEDLLIGSSNSMPTKAYLRNGTRFTEVKIDSLTGIKPYTESDLAICDFDKDGDNDVVIVAGGYENRNEEEYKHILYENRNGKFFPVQLPIPAFPASVVRLCDFNHDGYTDIFIGSRVKRGMFPYATHSYVLINKKGRFDASSVLKLDLGMVTDAVWSDYDNDGFEDLIVTREWNSVAIVKNIGGKELEPQIIDAVENKRGIWYSVCAGDFNKDGYTDYIIGNIGENSRFHPTDKYPMNLYAIDLDGDGNIDPVITGFWNDEKGKMTEYPLNYLDELWTQSKFFKQNLKDYASFSRMGINDIIDEFTMKKLQFKLDINTVSSYILWNRKGKFEWEKLPQSLQVAPITKMIADDFNKDGFIDVLLGGNDYSYDVSTGYFDANKGYVLLNKGTAKQSGTQVFNVLSPSKSGILLQGMLESLIYYKGDTTVVVAGFNRAGTNVYYGK